MRKKMAIFLAVIIALDVIALGVIFFTRNSSRPDISADAAPGADPTASTTQQELLSKVSFVAVGDNLISILSMSRRLPARAAAMTFHTPMRMSLRL